LDSYVTYLINKDELTWENIAKLITFNNTTYKRWYQLWIGKYFNDELHIILPEYLIYDEGDISVYVEKHKSNKVIIKQLSTAYVHGVDISKFEKVDCFKANKDLKYLYFDVLVPEKTFILKRDIDYTLIQKEKWHRQGEFDLSENDIEDIIGFCKKHAPKNYNTELACEYIEDDYIDKSTDEVKIKFYGKELKSNIHHSKKQLGYYLRITFANGINLLYKFENSELVPYMYSFKDRMFFAKEEYKKEYEYSEIAYTNKNESHSWFKKTWNNIIGFFVKKKQEGVEIDINAKEGKSEENEHLWWEHLWDFIVNLCFDNDTSSKN
jgi:hypothetical protein